MSYYEADAFNADLSGKIYRMEKYSKALTLD